MGFKLAVLPFFWQAVHVELIGDMGEKIKGEFKAKFRRPTQEEAEQLIQKVSTGQMKDQAVVDNWLIGWDGLEDESGAQMPFTPDNMAKVFDVLGMRAATVQTFLGNYFSMPEKNSGPQPATTTQA
ncbi:MAG: hypothetical protein KF796_19645 [Ramlibacter sp.]|nr:hypothetical protein [Ramlibacter sp.]